MHWVHKKYSEAKKRDGQQNIWYQEQTIQSVNIRLSLHWTEAVQYKLQQSGNDNHSFLHSMKEEKEEKGET